MLGECREAIDRRFGDDDEAHRLLEMRDHAVELIEEGDAGRAGTFVTRQVGGRTALCLRAIIVFVTREHHIVDDERVLSVGEQLGERDVARLAVRADVVERVVLGYQSAGRQSAARSGQRLHSAAQCDLLVEQPAAGFAVFGGFTRKVELHVAVTPLPS